MKLYVKFIVLAALLQLGVTGSAQASAGPSQPQVGHVSLNHITAGFSIDTVARVDTAASLGINTALNYGTPFTPSDPVGAEMQAKGMHEVDAGVSSDLFYYECHRTHTVAPPPPGIPNTYCATDEIPSMNSQTVLLAAIDAKLRADARNPLISGYWVLDDWAFLWDAGSAQSVLQTIHTHISRYRTHGPAICGLGVTMEQPGVNGWDPRIALNYSNAGCDMVGIYSYPSTSASYSDGSQLDYTMKTPLAAAFNSLIALGWKSSTTPLLGIGQAFAGPYGATLYQPGITSAQMLTQATAFCKLGAVSIGWYAWDDAGFNQQTLTAMTSTQIQAGIASSIAACNAAWGTPNGPGSV